MNKNCTNNRLEECSCVKDNRFEEIKALKEYFIKTTNIESDENEMKVLDSMCFRMWQSDLTLSMREKARKYDNLQEEFKCSFDTLLKVLKQGYVYLKDGDKVDDLSLSMTYWKNTDTINICFIGTLYDKEGYMIDYDACVRPEGYREIWWLKEDKSE